MSKHKDMNDGMTYGTVIMRTALLFKFTGDELVCFSLEYPTN